MTGFESAKSYVKKTARADPRAETRRTFVGCRWLVGKPIRILSAMKDRLRRATGREECREDRFNAVEA